MAWTWHFSQGFLDGWDGTFHGFGQWFNEAQKAAWAAGNEAGQTAGAMGLSFEQGFDAAQRAFEEAM